MAKILAATISFITNEMLRMSDALHIMLNAIKRQNRKKIQRNIVVTLALGLSLVLLAIVPGMQSGQTGTRDGGSVEPGSLYASPAHAAKGNAKTASSTAASATWTCPMHPHYISSKSGTCPICGMDLVKLETGDELPNTADGQQRSVVTIAPEVMQNMGIRLARVERPKFGRSIKSFGIVRPNERLRSEITARVEGWVEKLSVTAVGDTVEKGMPLFELYSPRLIISQNDYLSGSKARGGINRGLSQLRSFGVQKKALDLIKEHKRPLQKVPFFAERSGTISKLNLNHGTYVKRGMMLATIQSYAYVWLIVSVHEKDIGFITDKTLARVSFPNLPGQQVSAKVDYIYPTIDMKTRTGQVRLVLKNPKGLLRPGSYADVSFETVSESRTAVLSEAVLRSADGHYIVVALGEGRFEPRLVETGIISGRWTEVRSGVKKGEKIVVSGQFLIDSESALRESFRKLGRLQLSLQLLKLNQTEFAKIDHLIDAALYIHETLRNRAEINGKFLDPAIAIRAAMWPRFKNTKLSYILDDGAAALREAQKAQTPGELRQALNHLVKVIRPWIVEGAPDHYRELNISLYKEKKGHRIWLQLAGQLENPYYRSSNGKLLWPKKSPKSIKQDNNLTAPVARGSGALTATIKPQKSVATDRGSGAVAAEPPLAKNSDSRSSPPGSATLSKSEISNDNR